MVQRDMAQREGRVAVRVAEAAQPLTAGAPLPEKLTALLHHVDLALLRSPYG